MYTALFQSINNDNGILVYKWAEEQNIHFSREEWVYEKELHSLITGEIYQTTPVRVAFIKKK
jgi:hypothetical protein